jgi:hypothetical protein
LIPLDLSSPNALSQNQAASRSNIKFEVQGRSIRRIEFKKLYVGKLSGLKPGPT